LSSGFTSPSITSRLYRPWMPPVPVPIPVRPQILHSAHSIVILLLSSPQQQQIILGQTSNPAPLPPSPFSTAIFHHPPQKTISPLVSPNHYKPDTRARNNQTPSSSTLLPTYPTQLGPNIQPPLKPRRRVRTTTTTQSKPPASGIQLLSTLTPTTTSSFPPAALHGDTWTWFNSFHDPWRVVLLSQIQV